MARLNIKKITAVASAAAVMLSVTGCGENATWGATIDGSDIPAGIFIYYLQTAYSNAQTKLSEESSEDSESTVSADGTTETTDVFASQIEGKDAKTWIYDEATRLMQEYAAVESEFDKQGLEITDDEEDAATVYCDQIWDYYGDYYTEMGISEKSYISLYLNYQKRDKLFTALYSEGGEYGVPDDDIKAYLDENYAMINYIAMELKDGSGNLLKSDGKAEMMTMAEDYVERFKNGEDFDELNAEYTAYYENLQAEAEAEAEAEAAAEEADDDTETNTAEVVASDAEAALEEGTDEITEADADEADSAENTESDSEETTNEASEETASDESADTSESTDDASDDSETESDEETADSGEELSSNKTVIEKSGTTPDSAVVSKVFDEMEKGDIQIIESTDSETYYVVLKMDVLETDEYFETAKESLLYEMKSEDYDALITEWTEAQTVVRNENAYNRYDPEKLFGSN